MKQYCRYCAFCIDGDAYYCTEKDKVLREKQIKNWNRCTSFSLQNDIITGREYTPRKEAAQCQLEQVTWSMLNQ